MTRHRVRGQARSVGQEAGSRRGRWAATTPSTETDKSADHEVRFTYVVPDGSIILRRPSQVPLWGRHSILPAVRIRTP